MKLADWFRAKKQEWEARRKEQEAPSGEIQPLDADLSGIDPPETRFTEEYQAFLKQQESVDSEGTDECE